MSCSDISSARSSSLGVVEDNIEGDDVDYGVAAVVVDGFGAGI